VRAQLQQERRSNLDLFSSDVLYKLAERYRRLRERNKANAKSALDALLIERGNVLYDDCWAETLQFPAVYEADLREWLKGAEETGSIRIDGRKRPNEAPKLKQGHIIVFRQK
jgi:hypothetical protein